ncbi:ubiquitin-like domain-containing protein [Antribacter soli]|uniref:ubiquitin-like domain-containing protein n=1 Tax=Antribacter soli TaxID=2910976 RepID=UPI0027DED688|nr:ubiquitin-like domain-containing protein [Antribacter soli]
MFPPAVFTLPPRPTPTNQAPTNQAPTNQAPASQAPASQAPASQAGQPFAAAPPTGTDARGAVGQPGERPSSGSRTLRRRVAAAVAGGAALALVGSTAYAAAHKTVTLDVDGRVTTVATYAGSVERLLAEEGVRLGAADVMTPASSAALRDGGLVVVRYAHELMVEIDGERSAVRLAALDADEALARLGHLADADALVRLLPNRDGQRAVLPLRLDAAGPVALVVDGTTRTVPDGGALLDAFLADAGVTLDDDDRVSVIREPAARPGAPTVRVVVQRVVTADVATVTAIPFETITQEDPGRYADLPPAEVQAGVVGEHTRVDAVTTVDGVEQWRALVSDGVTRQPVPQILAQGTQVRPVPRTAAERASATLAAATASQPAAEPQPAPAPEPIWSDPGWDDWDDWDGWYDWDRDWGDGSGWDGDHHDGDRYDGYDGGYDGQYDGQYDGRDGYGGWDGSSSPDCSGCAEPGLG